MPVAWILLLHVLDMVTQMQCIPISIQGHSIPSIVESSQYPTTVYRTQWSVFSLSSDCESEEFYKWDHATGGQTVLLKCLEDDDQHHTTWITPSFGVYHSANKSYESEQQFHRNIQPHIEVLQTGHLLIDDFGRDDMGHYRCLSYNNSEGICRVINLGISDEAFRKLYAHSLYVGAATAGLFLTLVLLMQALCYLMNRFGCKCCWGTYISPKAKRLLRVIKTIEQYKTQQLDRLNQNYNSQVSNIKETFSKQMEHLQDSYASQMKSLKNHRKHSNQQLLQIRDQYNEQSSRAGEYSMRQLNKVHSNYMEQQDRVCRYTSRQLQQLTKTYKYQQKTFNKMVKNIPDFNISSCLYMDSKTFEIKHRSKCTSVNIERNRMISTDPVIHSKSLCKSIGSPDMLEDSGILSDLSATLRFSKLMDNDLLHKENNSTNSTMKNSKESKYSPCMCGVNLMSKSSDQQADQFSSSFSLPKLSKSEMILPGLTKEDKYSVGDKDGKKCLSVSVVKPLKFISFGPLL